MPAVKDFFQKKRKKWKLSRRRSGQMVEGTNTRRKKRAVRDGQPLCSSTDSLFLTAGSAGRAAGSRSLEPRFDVEAHVRVEFHGNGFRFFHQSGFNQEFVSVNFVYYIVVFLLIQSKRQARSASAGSHVYPDRGHFFAGEVHIELLFGSLCKFKHEILL
jgi:hypothetical protein